MHVIKKYENKIENIKYFKKLTQNKLSFIAPVKGLKSLPPKSFSLKY